MGRFYWLKMKRDFFKRHDIKIIEAMPNGKDYLLFYLKLLCESVDHDGNLRFSEQIPYNEEMLSVITNTNIDIVRSAIKVFMQLEMMEMMDDGTFYMNEVSKMIGSCADNDNANRQRAFRERKKQALLQDRYATVTKNNESKSKSKSIEIDNTYSQEFESTWSEYPKKQGKQNALKAYLKARNDGIDKDTILMGLRAYKRYIVVQKIEPRYVKQGSTWFNQRCWEDDYNTAENRKQGFADFSQRTYDYEDLEERLMNK